MSLLSTRKVKNERKRREERVGLRRHSYAFCCKIFPKYINLFFPTFVLRIGIMNVLYTHQDKFGLFLYFLFILNLVYYEQFIFDNVINKGLICVVSNIALMLILLDLLAFFSFSSGFILFLSRSTVKASVT